MCSSSYSFDKLWEETPLDALEDGVVLDLEQPRNLSRLTLECFLQRHLNHPKNLNERGLKKGMVRDKRKERR